MSDDHQHDDETYIDLSHIFTSEAKDYQVDVTAADIRRDIDLILSGATLPGRHPGKHPGKHHPAHASPGVSSSWRSRRFDFERSYLDQLDDHYPSFDSMIRQKWRLDDDQ